MMGNAGPGMLAGLRVVEIADERAEYTGLLLAGLGAEVVKIEPPEGNATRRIGPFLEDQPGLERSLFFWNYNRNKKSVVLDLRETLAREHLLRLLEGADVLLDASCGALNEALRIDRAALNARFPSLVTAREIERVGALVDQDGVRPLLDDGAQHPERAVIIHRRVVVHQPRRHLGDVLVALLAHGVDPIGRRSRPVAAHALRAAPLRTSRCRRPPERRSRRWSPSPSARCRSG